VREQYLYKHTRRGRLGPNTAYRKVTKRRFNIERTIDETTIALKRGAGTRPAPTSFRLRQKGTRCPYCTLALRSASSAALRSVITPIWLAR
jgi:hypothetical protein